MARIVLLTGAGVSAESGLGTFRDVGGLWDQYDLDEVATPQGYARNPRLVLEFYNARRANLAGAAPNAAHHALARLAEGTELTLVTQNVDNLHEAAGSPEVIHMHGELTRTLCARCGARGDAPAVMHPSDRCRSCGAATLRPDIVWFGEFPYHMERIEAALAQADIFAAIGTSGQVYPAAGFVALARNAGAHCVELNLQPSDTADLFHESHTGPATQIVPGWVSKITN